MESDVVVSCRRHFLRLSWHDRHCRLQLKLAQTTIRRMFARARMHTLTNTHTYVHIHLRTHKHTHTHTHTHTCTHPNARRHVATHTCARTHTHPNCRTKGKDALKQLIQYATIHHNSNSALAIHTSRSYTHTVL